MPLIRMILKGEWLARMDKFTGTASARLSWLNKPLPVWAVAFLLLSVALLVKEHRTRISTVDGDYLFSGFVVTQNTQGTFYVPIYEKRGTE